MSTPLESALRQLICWFLLITVPGGFILLSLTATAAHAAPLGLTSTESATISLRIPANLQVRGATRSLAKKTSATAASASFSSPFCITGSRGLQFSVSSKISTVADERPVKAAMTSALNQAYAGSTLIYRAAHDCPPEAGGEIVMQLTPSQYVAATNQGSITVTVAAE